LLIKKAQEPSFLVEGGLILTKQPTLGLNGIKQCRICQINNSDRFRDEEIIDYELNSCVEPGKCKNNITGSIVRQ
jgi:hypothetical protein